MGDQIVLILLSSILSIYRLKMIWLSFIALLPALVLSKSVVSADITEIQVCQYFDARIVRFEEKVKEMKELVDVDSEFYITLEASNLCDTVGRVAVPECDANHEGDDCSAAKIEIIKKPLLRAIKVEKSGKEFFDYCKYIGYKNVLKTFFQTRKLMSGECGLPGQKSSGDREPRNSLLLPLLVAGAYDPSSIWFQYFLCKDQQIYCYFFTQGWNQYEYGQYYLYENLLDDQNGIFAGSSDSSNLATLALLGGLGGGSPHSGYYPSPSGYSQVSAGRKRRSVDCEDGDKDCQQRQRRFSKDCEDGDKDCQKRQRRSKVCEDGDKDCQLRQRRFSKDCRDGDVVCQERKRRSSKDCRDGDMACKERRRRSSKDCEVGDLACQERKRVSSEDCRDGDVACQKRKRRSPKDCEVGDLACQERKRRSSKDCEDGEKDCQQRKRRGTQHCSDPDNQDDFCCENG